VTGPARRVEVGRAEEFITGAFRIVSVDGRQIGVVRLPDGSFRAVLNRCPHRGAPVCSGIVSGTWPPCDLGDLRYVMDGEVVVCPWHGLEFNLTTGESVFQREGRRLRVFQTSIEDGVVSVHV
jgi:nitrite reductase (NADH) small subunit